MEKEKNEIRDITVYRLLTNIEKAELHKFINQINGMANASVEELGDLCDSVKAFICGKIKNSEVQRDGKLGNYSGKYHVIGRGSTAYCYQADSKLSSKMLPALIKEFHPTLDAKEDISLCSKNECSEIPKCGFYWIADNAKKNSNSIKSFLSGFVRFIEQEDSIIDAIRNYYQSEKNNYFHPNLYISSSGIVYLDTDLRGTILTDKIEQLGKQDNFLNIIIDKLEMILRIAEGVAIYHEHKIFNGDLKPSNLFQVEDGGIPRVIRNIDFDTCISLDDVDKTYFLQEIRTTRSFYSKTAIDDLANIAARGKDGLSKAKTELLKLDISAIANILIYSFLTKTRIDGLLSYYKDSVFLDLGFYGEDNNESVTDVLFQALKCENSLVGLAIFKEIHKLIFHSLEAPGIRHYDIHGFIKQLNLIIAMLKCYNNGNIDVVSGIMDDRCGNSQKSFNSYLTSECRKEQEDDYYIPPEKILYFANLHRLDQVIKELNSRSEFDGTDKVEYKYSRKLTENTPEQYIRQIFFTK